MKRMCEEEGGYLNNKGRRQSYPGRKEPDGGDAKPNVGAAAVAAAAAAAPVRRRSMSSLVQGRAYSEKDEKVLKIAASDVAAITGFHEWVDVRELFLERLLYQDLDHVLRTDAANLGMEVEAKRERSEKLLAKAGDGELRALQRRSGDGEKVATVQDAQALQAKAHSLLKKAEGKSKLSKEEAEELESNLRHDINTRFGDRNEAIALAVYERRTGTEVVCSNERILVWPFPGERLGDGVPDGALDPPPDLAKGWSKRHESRSLKRDRRAMSAAPTTTGASADEMFAAAVASCLADLPARATPFSTVLNNDGGLDGVDTALDDDHGGGHGRHSPLDAPPKSVRVAGDVSGEAGIAVSELFQKGGEDGRDERPTATGTGDDVDGGRDGHASLDVREARSADLSESNIGGNVRSHGGSDDGESTVEGVGKKEKGGVDTSPVEMPPEKSAPSAPLREEGERQLVPGVPWPVWRRAGCEETPHPLSAKSLAIEKEGHKKNDILPATTASVKVEMVSQDTVNTGVKSSVQENLPSPAGVTTKERASAKAAWAGETGYWFHPSLTSQQRATARTAATRLGLCHDAVVTRESGGALQLVVWDPKSELSSPSAAPSDLPPSIRHSTTSVVGVTHEVEGKTTMNGNAPVSTVNRCCTSMRMSCSGNDAITVAATAAACAAAAAASPSTAEETAHGLGTADSVGVDVFMVDASMVEGPPVTGRVPSTVNHGSTSSGGMSCGRGMHEGRDKRDSMAPPPPVHRRTPSSDSPAAGAAGGVARTVVKRGKAVPERPPGGCRKDGGTICGGAAADADADEAMGDTAPNEIQDDGVSGEVVYAWGEGPDAASANVVADDSAPTDSRVWGQEDIGIGLPSSSSSLSSASTAYAAATAESLMGKDGQLDSPPSIWRRNSLPPALPVEIEVLAAGMARRRRASEIYVGEDLENALSEPLNLDGAAGRAVEEGGTDPSRSAKQSVHLPTEDHFGEPSRRGTVGAAFRPTLSGEKSEDCRGARLSESSLSGRAGGVSNDVHGVSEVGQRGVFQTSSPGRERACFVLVGAVDGVAEEVTGAPEDADVWETRRVVVEVKNRMNRTRHPPPLYDQIQLVTYMLMIGASAGDLVQYVKNGVRRGREIGGVVNTNATKQAIQELEEEILVSRVELDCRTYHHGANWRRTVLPRLYAFTRMVYRFRGDDLLRWRYLLAGPAEQRDMLVECCPYLDGVIARPAPSTLPSSVTAAATAKLSQEAGAADHDAATTALAAHDVVILDRPGVDDAGLTSTPDSNSSSSINPSSRDAVVDIVTMATPETRSDEEGFPRTGAGGDGVTDAARDHDNGDRRAIDKDADRQAVECDDTARTGCACASRPLIHVASASATNAASIISSGASSSAPTTSTIAAAANLTPAAPGTRGRPIPGDNEDQCGEETSDIPAPPLPASSFTPREAPTNVHGQGTAEVDGQVKKKKRKLGDPSYVETAARVQENLAADSVSPSPKKDKVDEEAAMERANKHMRGLMG